MGPLQVRVDLEVIALRGTLHFPDLKPHHQMLYCVKLMTPSLVWVGFIPLQSIQLAYSEPCQ